MAKIGFLHTSALHVETFRSLVADSAADVGEVHVSMSRVARESSSVRR